MLNQIQTVIKDSWLDSPKSSWIALGSGFAGMVVIGLLFLGIQGIFGQLPAYRMLEALHGTSNSLCFAGITASATIMPLLLTIFSFARRAETDFDTWFYRRIKNIALLCCGSFISGLFTLIVLSAPIGDIEVIEGWYDTIYYITVGGLAVMVGFLIAILVLLYFAILHIIDVLHP